MPLFLFYKSDAKNRYDLDTILDELFSYFGILFPKAIISYDADFDVICEDPESIHIKLVYRNKKEVLHVCLTDFPEISIYSEKICEDCGGVKFWDGKKFTGCDCD